MTDRQDRGHTGERRTPRLVLLRQYSRRWEEFIWKWEMNQSATDPLPAAEPKRTLVYGLSPAVDDSSRKNQTKHCRHRGRI